MIEVAFQNVAKYYGANRIFHEVSFEINRGERVALLGKNGTGKTTIFKILAGIESYDAGEVMIRKGAVVGLLDQIPDLPADFTVSDLLYSVFENLLKVRLQMAELEGLLAEDSSNQELLTKYGKLQEVYENQAGYQIDDRIHRTSLGLRINHLQDARFQNLSGGEKTRVLLARLVLQAPDILILDEPTNHLDLSSIEWLEEYLTSFSGTIILISHDRFFLDRVVGLTLELIEGRIERYEGNFTYYKQEKEARYLNQLKQYENQQKKIHQLETAAKRMHEWAKNADNPAMHRRAFSIEKRIERMEKTEKPKLDRQMGNQFNGQNFSGRDVVAVEGLIKAFSQQLILNHLDFRVQKGERVAILGENGSGKSTLLKILTGEVEPDSGAAKLGPSIRYAYLPQLVTFDQPIATVLETVQKELRLSEQTARCLLAKFNFKGENVFKLVRSLSGGEKSRLKLCLIMQQEVNLLILDEPTNHLDILSREWLEDALTEFQGTMAFVSHDRYFINQFATRIAELKNGRIRNYEGNYDSYKAQQSISSEDEATPTKGTLSKTVPKSAKTPPVSKSAELTIQKLEAAITARESQLAEIDSEMELAGHDFEKLDTLYQKRLEIEAELKSLYDQWSMIEVEE